jgi:chromosome segregation ATPase
MTVNHAPLNRPAELNAAADAPQDLDALTGPHRPAWAYERTRTGFPLADPDGNVVAYAVGEKAAAIITEGMTVYAQLDDDQIASEAEVRHDRDVLAAENGALRDERDQLRDQLAAAQVSTRERLRRANDADGERDNLSERTARQAVTIRDLLRQNVELDERVGRYARDRDDLRNQVIDLHDRAGTAETAVRAAREEAEDTARTANRYRDERDKVRTELGGCQRKARGFRHDVASALDLPTDTAPVAIVDRARQLAERRREELRGIARAMNAEAEAGGEPHLSDWLRR